LCLRRFRLGAVVSEGIPHRSEREIEEICCSHFIEPGDFDKPMSVRYWEDWFEIEGGPLAAIIPRWVV